jgi:hypothetical protein
MKKYHYLIGFSLLIVLSFSNYLFSRRSKSVYEDPNLDITTEVSYLPDHILAELSYKDPPQKYSTIENYELIKNFKKLKDLNWEKNHTEEIYEKLNKFCQTERIDHAAIYKFAQIQLLNSHLEAEWIQEKEMKKPLHKPFLDFKNVQQVSQKITRNIDWIFTHQEELQKYKLGSYKDIYYQYFPVMNLKNKNPYTKDEEFISLSTYNTIGNWLLALCVSNSKYYIPKNDYLKLLHNLSPFPDVLHSYIDSLIMVQSLSTIELKNLAVLKRQTDKEPYFASLFSFLANHYTKSHLYYETLENLYQILPNDRIRAYMIYCFSKEENNPNNIALLKSVFPLQSSIWKTTCIKRLSNSLIPKMRLRAKKSYDRKNIEIEFESSNAEKTFFKLYSYDKGYISLDLFKKFLDNAEIYQEQLSFVTKIDDDKVKKNPLSSVDKWIQNSPPIINKTTRKKRVYYNDLSIITLPELPLGDYLLVASPSKRLSKDTPTYAYTTISVQEKKKISIPEATTKQLLEKAKKSHGRLMKCFLTLGEWASNILDCITSGNILKINCFDVSNSKGYSIRFYSRTQTSALKTIGSNLTSEECRNIQIEEPIETNFAYFEQEEWHLQSFTNRKIYSYNDTVHLTGVVFKVKYGEKQVCPNDSFYIHIAEMSSKNPFDIKLSKKVITDSFGQFSFHFPMDKNFEIGNYGAGVSFISDGYCGHLPEDVLFSLLSINEPDLNLILLENDSNGHTKIIEGMVTNSLNNPVPNASITMNTGNQRFKTTESSRNRISKLSFYTDAQGRFKKEIILDKGKQLNVEFVVADSFSSNSFYKRYTFEKDFLDPKIQFIGEEQLFDKRSALFGKKSQLVKVDLKDKNGKPCSAKLKLSIQSSGKKGNNNLIPKVFRKDSKPVEKVYFIDKSRQIDLAKFKLKNGDYTFIFQFQIQGEIYSKSYTFPYFSNQSFVADLPIYSFLSTNECYPGEKFTLTTGSKLSNVYCFYAIRLGNNQPTITKIVHLTNSEERLVFEIPKDAFGKVKIEAKFFYDDSEYSKRSQIEIKKKTNNIALQRISVKDYDSEKNIKTVTMKLNQTQIKPALCFVSIYDKSYDLITKNAWKSEYQVKIWSSFYPVNWNKAFSDGDNENYMEYERHYSNYDYYPFSFVPLKFPNPYQYNSRYQKSKDKTYKTYIEKKQNRNRQQKVPARKYLINKGYHSKSLCHQQELDEKYRIRDKFSPITTNALKSERRMRYLNRKSYPIQKIKPDENGVIQFQIDYPNEPRKWVIQVFAYDESMNSTVYQEEFTINPEIFIEANFPDFLQEQDRCTLGALVQNHSSNNVQKAYSIRFFNPETKVDITNAVLNEKEQHVEIEAESSQKIWWEISVPSGISSLNYEISTLNSTQSNKVSGCIPIRQCDKVFHETKEDILVKENSEEKITFLNYKISEQEYLSSKLNIELKHIGTYLYDYLFEIIKMRNYEYVTEKLLIAEFLNQYKECFEMGDTYQNSMLAQCKDLEAIQKEYYDRLGDSFSFKNSNLYILYNSLKIRQYTSSDAIASFIDQHVEELNKYLIHRSLFYSKSSNSLEKLPRSIYTLSVYGLETYKEKLKDLVAPDMKFQWWYLSYWTKLDVALSLDGFGYKALAKKILSNAFTEFYGEDFDPEIKTSKTLFEQENAYKVFATIYNRPDIHEAILYSQIIYAQKRPLRGMHSPSILNLLKKQKKWSFEKSTIAFKQSERENYGAPKILDPLSKEVLSITLENQNFESYTGDIFIQNKGNSPIHASVSFKYLQSDFKEKYESDAFSIQKELFVKREISGKDSLISILDTKVELNETIVVRINIVSKKYNRNIEIKENIPSGFQRKANSPSYFVGNIYPVFSEQDFDKSRLFRLENLRKGIYAIEYEMTATHTGIFATGNVSILCQKKPSSKSNYPSKTIEVHKNIKY